MSPRTDRPPPFAAAAHVPVLTADEARAWDARTIERVGVPSRVLMESAGRAVAAVVQALHPDGRVVAAVGAGNNGGDAMVALRTLRAWGRDVAAVVSGQEPDSALLHGWEVPRIPRERAESAFRDAGVLIDGLLGTGVRGAPREPEAALIAAMGRSGRPVVAVDGPSGVDFTTGRTKGIAVRADVSVAFGAPRLGLLRFPGRTHAGRIVAVEIGFDPPRDGDAGARLVTGAWAHGALKRVPPDAHKGMLGKVHVVAGHAGMAGAAALAGLGALRAGAGMAVLVSPDANRTILQTHLPEALFVDRDRLPDGFLGDAKAVVCGPGMGTDDAALAVLLRVVSSAGDAPLLLDADALTMLARHPELRGTVTGPLVLTPHPGEAARLTSGDVESVLRDPLACAASLAERFRCTVLLKGTPSVVAAPGVATWVSVGGHSGIATGGMGDVMGGVIGGLLAFGHAPGDAAALGLWLCGRAAEIAGRGRGLLPRDVLDALPDALAEGTPAPSALPVPGVLLDLPPAA